jgi:hypothetical protein
MIFNSDLDIEHIFKNPGSSGFIPPNAIIFDPYKNEPYVISQAPVVEKPSNGFVCEIKNDNGNIVIDVSIISDEALYKVSEIKEMFNMITSVKMYIEKYAYIDEASHSELVNEVGLYGVSLKYNFTKEFTNKLINGLLGIQEAPSDMVDSLLDDIFGDSLKKSKNDYTSVNEKISKDAVKDIDNTDSIENLINPFLDTENYEVENDEENLDVIKFSKALKDIYKILQLSDCKEILNNQLRISNALNVFMNYDDTLEPFPPNLDILVKSIIHKFTSNEFIQSKISEFFNLVGYDLRMYSDLKNTNQNTIVLSNNSSEHKLEQCIHTKEFLFNELQEFYEQYNIFIKKIRFNNFVVEEKYKINMFCIIMYLMYLINKNYNKFRTELIKKEEYIDKIKVDYKSTLQMHDIVYVQKYHPELILEKYNLSTLENETQIVEVGKSLLDISLTLFNVELKDKL